MSILEKVILTIIIYFMIGILMLGAAMAYLSTKDMISGIMCFVVVVLVYTLGLIEEQ